MNETDTRDFFDHRYGHLGADRVAQERAAFHAAEAEARKANECTPGQECKDINRLCTKHQAQYQAHHGRASNE